MLLEEDVCYDYACILLAKLFAKRVSPCPASFCTPRPNLPVIPGYLLTSFFCILVPYDEKDRFSMLVLEGGVGIEPFNFSFFSIIGWRIDLNYCDIEWFALETNKDHSVAFEIAPKYCISDSSPKWPPNVCFYLLISRSCWYIHPIKNPVLQSFPCYFSIVLTCGY